jgi:hypothetical protein
MPCKKVEDGVFSTAEFKQFSMSVVPFLHITSRIEDRKHDELLYDYDENSFPAFLVLGADGTLLARHREMPTLDEFETTLKKVQRSIELRKSVAKKDKIDLLLLECELNKIDTVDLEELLEPLGELSKQQKKTLLALAADAEVTDMVPLIQRNKYRAAILADVGETFFDHFAKGGIPLGRWTGVHYWLGLGHYAWDKGDKALLDRALRELEPYAAKSSNVKKMRIALVAKREAMDKK